MEEGTQEQLVDDLRIARLITKLIFCMFATDVGLLDKWAFSDRLRENRNSPPALQAGLRELFQKMDSGATVFGHRIPRFNGWLFADDDVPEELLGGEINVLERLDAMNWTDVEPAIFGTLFERILDAGTRAKLGAHYTSRDDIELLVKPVLMALEREWGQVRDDAVAAMEKAAERGATMDTRRERLRHMVELFLVRLGEAVGAVGGGGCAGAGLLASRRVAVPGAIRSGGRCAGLGCGFAAAGNLHLRYGSGFSALGTRGGGGPTGRLAFPGW